MYVYAYNELFLNTHRRARSCTAGYRTGHGRVAQTDAVFIKRLCFLTLQVSKRNFNWCIELLVELPSQIFINLRNYFTNYKERSFVVTGNYVIFQIQLYFIATITPQTEKMFAPSKSTEKILCKT